MEQRTLGSTQRDVSIIGLGTWQLGADWGDVDDAAADEVLAESVAAGVTFFDTADVYGDGRSEQRIAAFRKRTGAAVTVATKMGRRVEQAPENYTLDHFRSWTDRSRANLDVDTLDLVQLHCPPTAVIEDPQTYENLAILQDEGAIAAYGVSVETCEQALAAIGHGVATIQIIVNAFRLKPFDEVIPAAAEAGVGVIARVPLASGLLAGGYTRATTFAPDDHRTFNRHGEAFDQGETFSGVDFETGVAAAQEFAELARAAAPGASTAQVALAWLAQQPGITTVIPGARNAAQARANAAAGSLPALGEELDRGVRDLYDARLRALVHDRW